MDIRDGSQLAALLEQPGPLAWAEGLFERSPQARCWFGWCTLDEVCAWSTGPAALRWVAGQAAHDPAAAEAARLRAVVFRDPNGTPLFGDDGPASPDGLPAGVVDRLLLASDCATGYRPPELTLPQPPADGGLAQVLAAYAQPRAVPLEGVIPQEPEAAVWVHAYGFAALALAESATWLNVPGGGTVRIDVLAWPALLADCLRTGAERDAEPLADEALARRLPWGAARSIIECADRLSELGGPLPGVRFQRPARAAGVDGSEPLAAAPDRPVPERAAPRAGG